MDNRRASEVLRAFNAWRRLEGEPEPFSDKEFSEATDRAIEVLDSSVVRADINSIIEAVTRETRVTDAEMCGRGRNRKYTEARAMVAWLAYHYTRLTQTAIGKRMNVTHATVIYYLRMVYYWRKLPNRYPDEVKIIRKLENELEQC